MKTRKDYFLDCLNVLLLREYDPGRSQFTSTLTSRGLVVIQGEAWKIPEDSILEDPALAAYEFFYYWHCIETAQEVSKPEWMIVAEELRG